MQLLNYFEIRARFIVHFIILYTASDHGQSSYRLTGTRVEFNSNVTGKDAYRRRAVTTVRVCLTEATEARGGGGG